MNLLFFWASWDKQNKYFYNFLLAIFALSLVFFVVCYFIGIAAVIHWDTSSIIEPAMLSISKFSLNLFEYVVEVEGFATQQRFFATAVQVNPKSAYLYLPFLFLGLSVGITVSTYLKTFSYFLSTSVIILFFVFLNSDLLTVYGLSGKAVPATIISAVVALSFYFHSSERHPIFASRFCAFSLLLILFAGLLYFGADVHFPFLYIANFGITGPMLLTILFIVIIGFEPVNFFVFLTAGTARTPNNKRRLNNFVIISILYLANVLLVLLKKMLFIDWDLLYVNEFLLYSVSSLIGIWGYRQRAVTFKEFIPFKPLAGFLYLALAIIANATMAYSFITGNDPMTECFEYAIIYSHVFFGFVFFIYVLINFGTLFSKQVSIADVIYKPLNLPFFMVRGIGAAAILSVFMYSNRFAFYLGVAGYFNLGGDVYNAEGNRLLSKQYYRSGVQYEFQNHRSNYSLAAIADHENDKNAVLEYYSRTLVKKPTPYDYINLSNFYLKEDGYFQAMFILRDGLLKFPESGYLANNLSLLYNRSRLADSSIFYLYHSLDNVTQREVPAANLLYFASKQNDKALGDSIAAAYEFTESTTFQSNKYHWHNLQSTRLAQPNTLISLSDSMTPTDFALWYNYNLNGLSNKADTAILKQADNLMASPGNAGYADAINFLKALKLYYTGATKNAFITLENLRNLSSNSTYYHKISGIWLMENGAYSSAAQSFKTAIPQGGEAAILNYCMAMAEAGKYEEIRSQLQPLSLSRNLSIKHVATGLQEIFTPVSDTSLLNWLDSKKLQYIHLRKAEIPIQNLLSVYESLKTNPYKLLAGVEIGMYYLADNNLNAAQAIYNELSNQPDLAANERNTLNFYKLELLTKSKNYKQLLSDASSTTLNRNHDNLRPFYLANALWGTGQLKKAEAVFAKAIAQAPFHEPGIIQAIRLQEALKKPAGAYNLAADAIQFYPASSVLLKEFCVQALNSHLISYADDALSQLQGLVSEEDYNAFIKIYTIRKAQVESELAEP